MLHADCERLSEPYSSGDNLASRLGVAIGHATALVDVIRADSGGSGVSWWTGIDERARLLITDHLVQCIESVEANLVEAELHRLELLAAVEDDDVRHAHPLTLGPDGYPEWPRMTPREKPTDELPNAFVVLHLVGFFRAVSSALDCLAGGVIGVIGIDESLLRADFGVVLREAHKFSFSTAAEAQAVETLSAIKGFVADAGPDGWLRWTLQMRNLLLHRPRRMHFSSWEPRNEYAGLVGPDERPVRMAWPRRHLPVEPSVADSEAFATADDWLPLKEDATATVLGVLGSVKQTSEATLARLLKFWEVRRASPELHPQPSKHLPEAKATERTNFRGYSGAGTLFPDQVITSPTDLGRLAAAQAHRKPAD